MKQMNPPKQLIWLVLLVFIAVGSACSLGKANAQKPATEAAVRTRPEESPTPAYKPLKRVSRDVIDTDKAEKKEESSKDKKKK